MIQDLRNTLAALETWIDGVKVALDCGKLIDNPHNEDLCSNLDDGFKFVCYFKLNQKHTGD